MPGFGIPKSFPQATGETQKDWNVRIPASFNQPSRNLLREDLLSSARASFYSTLNTPETPSNAVTFPPKSAFESP